MSCLAWVAIALLAVVLLVALLPEGEDATEVDIVTLQVQMSIMNIARGDMEVVDKYTKDPTKYDFRDVITKAGYG